MIRGLASVIRFALTFLCLLLPVLGHADSLRIAVASNFAYTLQTLLPAFEKATGHSVEVSSASSGKLYAQILHGAPFDVFLSADTNKPQRLAQQFPTSESTRFTYAIGRLVFWCPVECEYPLSGITANNLTIAIANPRLAPYGLAAQQTMDAFGLTSAKVVTGENIGQAYRFIESGNAAAGFVARSQVVAAKIPSEQYWLIPDEHHQPLEQAGILTAQGLNEPAAQAFITYLLSTAVQARIAEHGYDPLYD
ncbi:MAG TPA: molybdate ABC transporter substrate-binding protein [Oceanospirillales bacterium]|nr:molybdate ABC transporter substrate-binding protein [Oceanospirillales bacterium]